MSARRTPKPKPGRATTPSSPPSGGFAPTLSEHTDATNDPPLTDAVAALDARIVALTAQVATLKQQAPAIEAAERARGKTCLALTVQIVKCRWMNAHFDRDGDFPRWSYTPGGRRCHLGKAEPDQDCRHCPFVQLIPLGSTPNYPHHGRRYHDHGMVVPLLDQPTVDRVTDTLFGELGLAPLRDVQAEVYGAEDTLATARAQRDEQQHRAEVESAQRRRPAPSVTG